MLDKKKKIPRLRCCPNCNNSRVRTSHEGMLGEGQHWTEDNYCRICWLNLEKERMRGLKRAK